MAVDRREDVGERLHDVTDVAGLGLRERGGAGIVVRAGLVPRGTLSPISAEIAVHVDTRAGATVCVGTAVLPPQTLVMVRVVDAVGICGADEKDIQTLDDLVDRHDLRIGGPGCVFSEKLRCELYSSKWRSPFARVQACDDKQRRLGEDGRAFSNAKQLDRGRTRKARLRSVIAVRALGEIDEHSQSRKRR